MVRVFLAGGLGCTSTGCFLKLTPWSCSQLLLNPRRPFPYCYLASHHPWPSCQPSPSPHTTHILTRPWLLRDEARAPFHLLLWSLTPCKNSLWQTDKETRKRRKQEDLTLVCRGGQSLSRRLVKVLSQTFGSCNLARVPPPPLFPLHTRSCIRIYKALPPTSSTMTSNKSSSTTAPIPPLSLLFKFPYFFFFFARRKASFSKLMHNASLAASRPDSASALAEYLEKKPPPPPSQ